MSNNFEQRLFYVVRESDRAYSLYSVHTDHLILAEVTSNVISDFLFLNEPTNPAIQRLESNNSSSSEVQTYGDYISCVIPEESGFKTYFELNDRCSELVSYHMDYSGTSLADSWNVTLSNLNVTQNPKQLEFDFVNSSNNLKGVHKNEYLLESSVTKRIINESNSENNSPKAQSASNSEWKELIIDDD